MLILALIMSIIIPMLTSCNGNVEEQEIHSPRVYTINAPVAGNYPQGLYKYPYKVKTREEELFTQTLEWSPKINKTFAVDTQYTAVLTLIPVDNRHTFKDITPADVKGLPTDGVEGDIKIENKGRSLVIRIVFEKTASTNAERKIVFSDEFDGTSLDPAKWDKCPEWDRQGRSSWRDDMVSVSDGNLCLKFKRDPELGKTKSNNKSVADNWIRAGGIRTRQKNETELFNHGYGFYEASIKFQKVEGIWGAFWLMSPTAHILSDEGIDGTEIDIVETIHNENGVYNAALHWNGYGDAHKSAGSDGAKAQGIDIYDGSFHTFAVDWSPSEYIFYVDGVEFWRADGGANSNNSGINQNPNYIKLTVESAEWAGVIPTGFTEGEMLVDYVKVYNQPKP